MEAIPRPVRVDLRPARVSDALHFRRWRAEPSVRVVVAMREPEDRQLSARSRQIKQTRNRVFFDVKGSEFDMKYRWNHVSAVAGDVTAAGLAKIRFDSAGIKVTDTSNDRITDTEMATPISRNN